MKPIALPLTVFILIFILLNPLPARQSAEKSIIIKRHGNGFLEEKTSGLRVLHLRGNAYERGFQRGMLQSDLGTVTLDNITELAAWFGGENLETGLAALHETKKTMEPFIPYQFRREMKGMADALAKQGSPVTYDDIVLHMVGADYGMMNPGTETPTHQFHGARASRPGAAPQKTGNSSPPETPTITIPKKSCGIAPSPSSILPMADMAIPPPCGMFFLLPPE